MRVQVPVYSPPSPPPSLYSLLSFLSRFAGVVYRRGVPLFVPPFHHLPAPLFILPFSPPPASFFIFIISFFHDSSRSLRFKEPCVVLVHETTFGRGSAPRMREVAPSAGESLTAGHPPPSVPRLPLM